MLEHWLLFISPFNIVYVEIYISHSMLDLIKQIIFLIYIEHQETFTSTKLVFMVINSFITSKECDLFSFSIADYLRKFSVFKNNRRQFQVIIFEKHFNGLTLSPVKNRIISAQEKSMEIRFVPAGPINTRIIVSRRFQGSLNVPPCIGCN